MDSAVTFKDVFLSLRERIGSGEITGQLPSLARLQQEYDVSSNTVKKALTLLKEQRFTIGRQGKGVFVNPTPDFNPLAQKVVTLFLLPTVMRNPFYSRLVLALRSMLESERCDVNIINTVSQLKAFAGHLDVLLLFERFDTNAHLEEEQLIARNRVIYCNCHAPTDAWMVGSDNFAAGFMAAEYLYGLGARRLGVLGVTGDGDDARSHFFHRLHGVRSFAARHSGLKLIESAVPIGELEEHIDPVWAERLFTGRELPDAIFMCMDMMAFSVFQHCRRFGLQLPVLGHDDQDFATHMCPGLSSIREDADEVARCCVAMIRRILCGESKPETILVPPRLIKRESTEEQR